jgi:hypothetical protein
MKKAVLILGVLTMALTSCSNEVQDQRIRLASNKVKQEQKKVKKQYSDFKQAEWLQIEAEMNALIKELESL